MQPFGASFRGLDGQRLQRVRLEELAGLLGCVRIPREPGTRRDDEQRQMIAAAFLGVQNVIAEAQAIGARLAAEPECVDRRCGARREQVDGVAVALGFEELPDRFHLHESRGFRLHFLDIVEQLQRLRIALGQQLFEIALEPEMPPVKHVGIDVAPDLGQIRHVADAAVEVRRGGNRDVGAHLRASRLRGWNRGFERPASRSRRFRKKCATPGPARAWPGP